MIRNGTVIDGTGAVRTAADVAVDHGLVTLVGSVPKMGSREVDAEGLLVTPGFVDVHTHYDGQATWDNQLAPSSWHGVTTVVAGNCGVGFAPVRPADHERLIELMEGVEDIPGAALHEGLAWNWQSFPSFLDALETRSFDIDLATQVPHGALRLHVMGERGARREAATPTDIGQMAELAAEAVEAGAIGFTTSRTRNHRTSTGDYTPTLEAEEAELVGIAEALGAAGKGVLQVVSDFTDVNAEFAMLRRMAEQSGRPLALSLVQHHLDPTQWRRILELLTEANEDGLQMIGQVAPRPVGVILGLDLSMHPFMAAPLFVDISDQRIEEQVQSLSEPAFRSWMIESCRTGPQKRLISEFDRMFELHSGFNYEPDPSQSLAARAQAAGVEPAELALDILLQDEGRGMIYFPFLNYVDGNLEATREMLVHAHTIPGLADGGAHVGTICDGSFPTTLLSHWGRDRSQGRIELEFLVQRHCRDTARSVGLDDRGTLEPGARADINVIDFDALEVHRPEVVHDLPAGGRRLLQRADGYRHTFVAGQETYADGEPTGALPGRLIRGAQSR